MSSVASALRFSTTAHSDLRNAYDFWRTVESRLRIVHNGTVTELPNEPGDLARLARRLNYAGPELAASAFREDAARHASRARELFMEIVGSASGTTSGA